MFASPMRRNLILMLCCCVVAALSVVAIVSSAGASTAARVAGFRKPAVASAFQGSTYFDMHARMVINAEIAAHGSLALDVDGKFGLPAVDVSMIAFDASATMIFETSLPGT